MGVSLSAMVAVRTGVANLGVDIESSLSGADVAMIVLDPAPALTAVNWSQVQLALIPPSCDQNGCSPSGRVKISTLEMSDGSFVKQRAIEWSDAALGTTTEWTDADGNVIDEPRDLPELDMSQFSRCGRTGLVMCRN